MTTRLGLADEDVQQTTARGYNHLHDELRRSERMVEKAAGRLLKPPHRATGRQQPMSDRPNGEHKPAEPARTPPTCAQADQQTITHQPREHPLTSPRRRRLTACSETGKWTALNLAGAHQPQVGDLPDDAHIPLASRARSWLKPLRLKLIGRCPTHHLSPCPFASVAECRRKGVRRAR